MAETGVCRKVLRVQLEHLLQLSDSFIVTARHVQRESQVIVSIVGKRVQLPSLPGLRDGLRVAPEEREKLSVYAVGLARGYAACGEFEASMKVAERAVAMSGGWSPVKSFLANTLAAAGRTDDARKLLEEIKRAPGPDYLSAPLIAAAHGLLGHKDEAFAKLEKAFEYRLSGIIAIQAYPWFEPLRSDPRFQNLLRRMNFPS